VDDLFGGVKAGCDRPGDPQNPYELAVEEGALEKPLQIMRELAVRHAVPDLADDRPPGFGPGSLFVGW
jgi:hypothetical protein